METAIKTDVDIIQELLAIYTARNEAITKIISQTGEDSFKQKISELKQQTDQFIKKLMDELSLYGDAVAGEVNRSNGYLKMWQSLSTELGEKNDAEVQQQFRSLEEQLKEYYRQINATRSAEAGSLDEVLKQQEARLQSSFI